MIDERVLKTVAGFATVAACVAAAVLVITDPKPAAAPLRPPVVAQAASKTATPQAIVPRVSDVWGTAPLTTTYVS